MAIHGQIFQQIQLGVLQKSIGTGNARIFQDLRIERFHVTSRRPYWCSKTKKRRPYWCPKPVLLELNSIFMQKSDFV